MRLTRKVDKGLIAEQSASPCGFKNQSTSTMTPRKKQGSPSSNAKASAEAIIEEHGAGLRVLHHPPQVRPSMKQTIIEAGFPFAEFLRLPKPPLRCPVSSLSRTTLVELGQRGLISMKKVRSPGATRGIVLIVRRSLTDFLHSCENVSPGDSLNDEEEVSHAA